VADRKRRRTGSAESTTAIVTAVPAGVTPPMSAGEVAG
jgi:hypothetical protein